MARPGTSGDKRARVVVEDHRASSPLDLKGITVPSPASSPPAVGPSRPEELPAIAVFLTQSGLPVAGLDSGNVQVLVARQGERIVGTAALERCGSACVLRSLAVEKALRGGDLARRLIAALLELARDSGCTEAYLLTHNVQRLASRYAFRVVRREEVSPLALASPEFGMSGCAAATVMRLALSPENHTR